MFERNPGCELGEYFSKIEQAQLKFWNSFEDLGWLNNVYVNEEAVKAYANELVSSKELIDEYRAAWLLRAVTCIDLTTLAGDDTNCNVSRMCSKAARPIKEDILNEMGFSYDDDSVIHTAAVCVYPARVENAVNALKKMNMLHKINVASGKTVWSITKYSNIKCNKNDLTFNLNIKNKTPLVCLWHQIISKLNQSKKI